MPAYVPPVPLPTAGSTGTPNVFVPNAMTTQTLASPLYQPVPTSVHQPPLFPYSVPIMTPQAARPTHNVAAPLAAPVPHQTLSGSLTAQQAVELIAATRREPLPEWKLSSFDGDPLQWPEWIGQFRSAIDNAVLTDDVKLTYLKTLVTGKAKSVISGFAYCGKMYKDALKALERKFGQPQIIVGAYLDKLNSSPPVKMHHSESLIAFSCMITSLIGVLKSLGYEADLKSSSVLSQAVSKLPPNLREAWSTLTVKQNLSCPSLVEFGDWIQQKAEAHDRMLSLTPSKQKAEANGQVVKTKPKTFVASAEGKPQALSTNSGKFEPCKACNAAHSLFRCPMFGKKTPTERAKFCAAEKLCFSCLRSDHRLSDCPKRRQCSIDGCQSNHNTLLHGAERIFTAKKIAKPSGGNANQNKKNASSNVVGVEVRDENSEVIDVSTGTSVSAKGILQVVEVELVTPGHSRKVFALCDTGSTNSWISKELCTDL